MNLSNLSLIAFTSENNEIAKPPNPIIPNPGVINNSTPIKIIPIMNNIKSSMPDKPAI